MFGWSTSLVYVHQSVSARRASIIRSINAGAEYKLQLKSSIAESLVQEPLYLCIDVPKQVRRLDLQVKGGMAWNCVQDALWISCFAKALHFRRGHFNHRDRAPGKYTLKRGA